MLKFNKAEKLPKTQEEAGSSSNQPPFFRGELFNLGGVGGGVGFVQTLIAEGLVKVHVLSLHHEFSPIGLLQPPVVNPYTNQSPRNVVWK